MGGKMKSIEDLLYVENVSMYELAFEEQYHYGVAYAWVKLREQEIRNMEWMSNILSWTGGIAWTTWFRSSSRGCKKRAARRSFQLYSQLAASLRCVRWRSRARFSSFLFGLHPRGVALRAGFKNSRGAPKARISSRKPARAETAGAHRDGSSICGRAQWLASPRGAAGHSLGAADPRSFFQIRTISILDRGQVRRRDSGRNRSDLDGLWVRSLKK